MYQVRWLQSAINQLAPSWGQADASTAQSIRAAMDWIDQSLQRDPANEGESRSNGRRIMFAPPLAVVFRIEPDGQTVSILSARFFRRPRA